MMSDTNQYFHHAWPETGMDRAPTEYDDLSPEAGGLLWLTWRQAMGSMAFPGGNPSAYPGVARAMYPAAQELVLKFS